MHGPDAGGYYHERFLRGMRWLAQTITPFKVKGTGIRQKSKPHPDFSLYATIKIVPSTTVTIDHTEHSFFMTTLEEDLTTTATVPESTMPRSLSVVSHEDDPWTTCIPDSANSSNSLHHMVDTTPLMEELIITGGGIVDHVDYSKTATVDDWHWEEDEVQSAMYDLVHQPAGITFDRFLQDLAVEARIQT